MLISKFNKLIHNKIVWAVFAVLVSMSLVGLFAPSMGGPEEDHNAIGEMFGEQVTRQDLSRARLFSQAFQTSSATTPDEQKLVMHDAWRRLAFLGYARHLDIKVTDTELSEAIRRDPTFAVDGTFSRQRYQQLVLEQLRIPIDLFEAYLREELLMAKAQRVLANSLWVAPYELNATISRFTDQFVLQLAEIQKADLVDDVQADDEAVQALYESDPERFEVPAQRRVNYVQWDAGDFVDEVTISKEQIAVHYEQNLDRYRSFDPETAEQIDRPLEEVDDEIRRELEIQAALARAGEVAMQFLDALSMIEYGADVTLQSTAAQFGMNVHTSAFFTMESPVQDPDAGFDFNEAAFLLNPEIPERSYSPAVIDDDAIYIMTLQEHQPAFLPPFEAVAETVREAADRQARETAFNRIAEEIHTRLKNAIEEGQALDTIASELELSVQTAGPFSIYDATPEDLPHFEAIAHRVLSLDQGDLSEPIDIPGGNVIVHVAERRAGDPAEAIAMKPDINRMLLSRRLQLHLAAWADTVLDSLPAAKPMPATDDLD